MIRGRSLFIRLPIVLGVDTDAFSHFSSTDSSVHRAHINDPRVKLSQTITHFIPLDGGSGGGVFMLMRGHKPVTAASQAKQSVYLSPDARARSPW